MRLHERWPALDERAEIRFGPASARQKQKGAEEGYLGAEAEGQAGRSEIQKETLVTRRC